VSGSFAASVINCNIPLLKMEVIVRKLRRLSSGALRISRNPRWGIKAYEREVRVNRTDISLTHFEFNKTTYKTKMFKNVSDIHP